jgi:chitin disaccharide deacetylase
MPPIRLLVINADDLGFAPGVNRGILDAHAAGTVSSASMMVAAPGFGDAVERVRS